MQPNHLILKQLYDILTKLQAQDKKIKLCKVPAHIGIKGIKEANKPAKQVLDMPGITTIRLHYTDHYLIIRMARSCK